MRSGYGRSNKISTAIKPISKMPKNILVFLKVNMLKAIVKYGEYPGNDYRSKFF
jgi:hypothetical protein